jgi:hypothetical protein
MIIEIIVLLGFLGSLIGFIFFVKHYFKTSKARSNNKKMLLAIESSNDEYASNDKFYKNILNSDFINDINWGKVIMFTFFIGIAVFIYWNFSASNTDTSSGNGGVEKPIVSIVNNSNNQTIANIVPGFLKDSNGQLSFWFFLITGGLMMWIILKVVRRSSYDY